MDAKNGHWKKEIMGPHFAIVWCRPELIVSDEAALEEWRRDELCAHGNVTVGYTHREAPRVWLGGRGSETVRPENCSKRRRGRPLPDPPSFL